MPDCPKSTPAPEAQQRLAALVEELHRFDERLSLLANAIAHDPETTLPSELRAGVEVVREDLLSDAIETLAGLAALTEDAVLKRRGEIADVIAWLADAA
jgi:hypothetical protein